MATNTPQDDWTKSAIRLPKDLHAKLHEAATASGRSYNAEMIARIEQAFIAERQNNAERRMLEQQIAGTLADIETQQSYLDRVSNSLQKLKAARDLAVEAESAGITLHALDEDIHRANDERQEYEKRIAYLVHTVDQAKRAIKALG